MSLKGIDVSVWQNEIDWPKVKKAGIDFAIIREGFGKNEPCQVDRRFRTNIDGAKKAGIYCGVYHYSYALSTADALNEANFCLENIKGYELEYPVAFDIEDSSMMKLGKDSLTEICKSFCSTIEDAGYYVCIYTNLNWLRNYLNSSELLKKYDLWLAEWDAKIPAVDCGIWQYSSKGKVDGISGNVDLNISYKNYPSIIKNMGLNGFNSSTNVVYHTVEKGDTLWGIAQKYLGVGSRYPEIKSVNNIQSDIIYAGQVLKIFK